MTQTRQTAQTVRIVQFGQGVFLRGFVDWMVHRLNHEAGCDLRVTLVQPRDGDEVERLLTQGGRYPLTLQGRDGDELRDQTWEIDCIDAGLNTHRDPDAFEALARDPQVRVVVSNTTEAGIAFDEQDASRGPSGREKLRSFPAKLAWFLERRRAAGITDPLHVLPCELVEDNGRQLRGLVLRLAEAWGLIDFEPWLDAHVVFHDTLVDRIVPGRPADATDPFAVTGEWFHSWGIRGSRTLLDVLPLDRLDLNVFFTDDLAPHRDLKVRTLNAVHTAMTPVGVLAGLATVRDALEDPEVGRFVEDLIQSEILPTIDLPQQRLQAWTASVLDRFANPFIDHALLSIALNGVAKVRSRLFPVVRDLEASGVGAPPRLAEALAAFIAFHRPEDAGRTWPLRDDPAALDAFERAWAEASADAVVRRVFTDPALFGEQGPWSDAWLAAVAERLAARGVSR